jgi:transcriptional regulator with AAA-type ATPase domain
MNLNDLSKLTTPPAINGRAMPQLHFHSHGRDLFVHPLREGRTVIGRSDRCDIALPGEAISRVHCALERRTEGWWLYDRSRHGVRVNGLAVERHLLADQDEIVLGPYSARFSMQSERSLRSPTASTPLVSAVHEDLVEVTESGFAACRAELHFTRGPQEGRTILLQQPRTSLGGPGASLHLDDNLPANSVIVRVVRGRAMIEPADAPAFLSGVRVREITPAVVGEEVRVGQHGFAVNIATVEQASPEMHSFGEMVGTTPGMRRLFGVLNRMAAHDHPALLTGESGTGKELAAQGLHTCGLRSEGPFIAINCASIAESLFESELFGHIKGAFTGATQQQDGAFHHANGGTLFLDEIGELKLELQAKLLRALESGEVKRVGSSVAEYPDVRVVCATNRDLPAMCREGLFREDLYFRLAVLTVGLPPLRDRAEDIRHLATTLLERNHPGSVLANDAANALEHYEWPGNIRELRNVLTRATVLGGPVITPSDLSFNPWAFEDSPRAKKANAQDAERKTIIAALKEHGGNRTRAARDLGMPRSSLLYKMNKYGISVT